MENGILWVFCKSLLPISLLSITTAPQYCLNPLLCHVLFWIHKDNLFVTDGTQLRGHLRP
jgi:hypothetical protein